MTRRPATFSFVLLVLETNFRCELKRARAAGAEHTRRAFGWGDRIAGRSLFIESKAERSARRQVRNIEDVKNLADQIEFHAFAKAERLGDS